jgi:predicted TPR repeat methyltransferase
MESPHDHFTQEYEAEIEKADCWVAEVLFGFCYADIKSGESLLDVGIGTGLSSRLFHLAGLRIFGIDGSRAMLDLCASKGITEQLVHQDILEFPWPYGDSSIKHVISCGVFQCVDNLEAVFAEIRRIQMDDGLFCFTVMKNDEVQDKNEQIMYGIPIYSHSARYIHGVLETYHYKKMKEIVCLVGDLPYRVIEARKRGA